MDFDGLQAALNARDDVQRSGWLGPIQIQIEIIANDTTITSRSVVSHVGMRFVGWVRACPPRGPCYLFRKSANGYEPVHNWEFDCDGGG